MDISAMGPVSDEVAVAEHLIDRLGEWVIMIFLD